VKEPANLKSWPWIVLAGAQFGGSDEVTLSAPKRAEQTLRIVPALVSEVAGLAGAGRPRRGGDSSGCCRNGTFPVNVLYPRQRKLSARVRAFVDFAGTRRRFQKGKEADW
jgi:hypothetical protein